MVLFFFLAKALMSMTIKYGCKLEVIEMWNCESYFHFIKCNLLKSSFGLIMLKAPYVSSNEGCMVGSNHTIQSHMCPLKPLFYFYKIFRIFLICLSKEHWIFKFFFNTIMLRCILKSIPKYIIKKYFQIVLLVSKLLLSCIHVAFKQRLQEVKNTIHIFHSLDWFQISMIFT